MNYRYTPKYVRENLNYQAGELVKHGDYNRSLNLLNVAVDNNTEALRNLMNDGGAAALNALALDDATLIRHREHVLEDNDEQVPSSKAVYQHVEETKNNINNSLLNINNILSNQYIEMANINLRIGVVNSLIAQYGARADEIETVGERLSEQFEFTYGTLHGGEAGQVLGKRSANDLDYAWLDRIPGPEGPQGPPGSVNVINDFSSTSTTDALSAGKGKDLNDRLSNLDFHANGVAINQAYDAAKGGALQVNGPIFSNQTEVLTTNGGTMTNNLSIRGSTLRNGIAVYGAGNIDPNTTLDEIILTLHNNCPTKNSGSDFYYIRTTFFSGDSFSNNKSTGNNRVQEAIAYGITSNRADTYVRAHYSGTWYPWRKQIKEDNIVDNLISTSTTDVLSANQGKILQDTKATVDFGFFTPTLTDGTNEPTHTYQEGYYYTVGSLVFVEIYIAISSKGSCSGTVRLGNLPFNIGGMSSRILQGLQIIYAGGITYPAGINQICFGGPRSVNYMALYGTGASSTGIKFSDIADTTTMRITGWYRYG